jgi:multidrug efflux pump subunit AcrA (membrane-fusion protein)
VTTPPTTPSVPPSNPPTAPVEFPDSITDGTGPNWRRRTFTAAGVAIVVALVAGVGVARASGSTTTGYRTATVSTQDVQSVLTGVGSIEPISQATVTFPVGGTVATVDVAVGQSVGTGQQLATLDPQSLTAALNQKQAALASAELTLSKALAGSASGSSSGSAGTSASGGAGGTGGAGSTTSGTAVADAQKAVVAAQHAVDHSLTAADQALASAQQVCAGAGPTPTTTSTTSTSTTSTTTPGGGGGGGSGGADPCLTAQEAVATAQAQVAADQKALSKAVADLTTAISTQASSGGGSASRGTTGSSGATSSAAARTTTGGSGTSAADLIADQAAVDSAAAAVAVAQQNLAATTIVSPISGVVAAVNLTVGASVSAGSTTANVIIVGQGGMEVTTPVSVDQISDVKVGQRATVLPDGGTNPLPGQVVAIGLVPTSSTRSTTYTVTIGLDDAGANLFNGSTATVAITTAGATSVLAVPTSAVQVNGAARTVTVLDGGTTSTVTVKTGVVGSQWTQVTDGLTAGQVVVIADLSQPLPGSATASTNGQTTTTSRTGAASFPGAGAGGGGFGGIRPGG